jgi:NADH-quinone oxidoreductase subunit C
LSSTADAPPSDTASEAPPVDEAREAMRASLAHELGDGLVDSFIRPGADLWVRVETDAWADTARAAHDVLGCTYFTFLSAIDWKPSPWGRGEDDPTEPPPERSTEVVQGVTGGATRFQVLARVYSTTSHLGITLKADIPDDNLRIASWIPTYAGADWHEREAWEMFGIEFVGHPHLMHIYLPGDFEGHPLRKDFPLIARMVKPWPGIVDVEPLPAGGDDEEADSTGDAS